MSEKKPNKRDAPELWSMLVGIRSCLSPMIANVMRGTQSWLEERVE
jgi:hypothetical protein